MTQLQLIGRNIRIKLMSSHAYIFKMERFIDIINNATKYFISYACREKFLDLENYRYLISGGIS